MADFWTDRQDGDIIEADEFNMAFSEIDKKMKTNANENTQTAKTLSTHISDESNPHNVTAEQTGAYEKDSVYNKTEIDSKLVLAGTNEETVDLTTVTDSSGAISPEVTSSTLGAGGGPFKITLDNTKSYRIKGVFEGVFTGYVQIDGNYLFDIENANGEFTKTFDYVGSVGTITVYSGNNFNCTFEEFVAITEHDGFISAADKAKLDGLPNDAYSKSETDSKIDLLSLKAEKSGEALRISDACELEQTADVSIASKNLIPYPYTDTTKTVNGVTFTDNGDGTITANGTATADTGFMCQNFLNVSLPKGNYTASGTPSDGGRTYYTNFAFRHNSTAAYDSSDYGTGLHFSLPDGADKVYVFIRIKSGATLNNAVFKPQLELGTQATAYTPHVSDISSVAVKKYGKNLIPYPYAETTRTDNGITFTDNGDGSITANGTATELAVFHLCYTKAVPDVIGQTVTLSGCPSGGAETTYRLRYQQGSISSDIGNGATFTVAVKGQVAIQFFAGQTANNLVFKPQLELGNAVTDYELYKAPVTYTADSDGKVSGVTLGSDTATLTTDTDGVIINAKYKKDITKAFAQLEEKINSLSSASTVANIETL